MIRQHVMAEKLDNGNLYYFMDYKKKKPFYRKPIKIMIGNPFNDTYYMVKNVVYKGKQILALNQKKDPKTIVLVEAQIEEGKLIHISMLSKESLEEISRMLAKTI